MSFQAMTWAINQKCETSLQKFVLLMLANHTNDHSGQCNPSHARLAHECCMSISTLRKQIVRLEQLGFLTIIRKIQDGVSLPNQYSLNLSFNSLNCTEDQPEIESEGGMSCDGIPPYVRTGGMPSQDRGVGRLRTGGPSSQDTPPCPETASEPKSIEPIMEPKNLEPKREPEKKYTKKNSHSLLALYAILGDLADDFIEHRKVKKAPITKTAMDGFQREAGKAGITIAEAVRISIERNWQGFKAEWILEKPEPQQFLSITEKNTQFLRELEQRQRDESRIIDGDAYQQKINHGLLR